MLHGLLSRFARFHKRPGKPTGLRAIQARTRLITIAFAGFGLILLAIGVWRAANTFHTIRREERLRADAVASRVANHLALILNERFADLRFLGQSLLGSQPTGAGIGVPVKAALRAFLATHVTLRDVNILNARGTRILWSARRQPAQPILPVQRFHAVRDDPRLEIGDAAYARRFHAMVIPLRYRVTSYRGPTQFFIGDPVDLGQLPILVSHSQLIVRLTTRSGRPFAVAAAGVWRPLSSPAPKARHATRANVPGYPWRVDALWSRTHLWALWWQHTARWLPLFILLLWGSQYTGLLLANLLSQEMQLRLWHEGLHGLNQAIPHDASSQELFSDAARLIQDNLDAPFVFVGWRNRGAVAGSCAAQTSAKILDAAFAHAADRAWRPVAQEAFPLCMALALGTTEAIIVVCPSQRAQAVIWHGMVRELAGHLTATLDEARQRLEIKRLQSYQMAVRTMQLELLRQPTPDEAQSLLVRILTEQTDIAGAFIAVPETTGPRLRIETAAARDPELRAALLRLTPSQDATDYPFGQMLAGRTFRTGAPQGPVDPHDDAALAAAMAGHDVLNAIHAVLAYPITEDKRDHPTAVLVVTGTDPEYFTPALRALLEHLVASVRLALGAWRTRRQTDRYRAFYEALARASQAIARASESQAMFRNICHILAECTGVSLTFISLLEAKGAEVVASAGRGQAFLSARPGGNSTQDHALAILHERARQADTPCLFEKADQWLTDEALRREAGILGLVSALTVPWRQDGKVAGILGIIAGERTFFDEDMTRLMEALGDDIGFAMSNYEHRRELTRLSLYDPLTMLPNRAYFERSTLSAMARATRSGQILALGIMDLDGFKEWNDLQGHAGGDDLLKTVAQKLREVVRGGEGAARLGGDEFGLAVNIDSVEALSPLSARLLSAIALADPETQVTASVGWAIYASSATSYETLLIQADDALYAAKAAGRNTYRVFEGDIAERFMRRRAIHERFPAALADGQVIFMLQPQARCATGRVEGVELLVRWRDDDKLLAAERFIPDVEKEPRLIRALGRQTVGEAIAVRERLRAAGHELRVSFNIGAHYFLYPTFVDEVTASLGGLSAVGLCVKLPLGMALADARRAAGIMLRLKDLGFSVALGNFGTGSAPLNEAAELPADELRLDRQFIRRFRRDPGAIAVAGAAVVLANLSGRRLVAEGIETPEDLRLWRHMGGEYYQGYLLAHPLIEADLLARLATAPSCPATEVPVFSTRDLLLAAYAFLEWDDCPDDILQASHARLGAWMHKRAVCYRELSQWTLLATTLNRGLDLDAQSARAFWRDQMRPAILALFREIEARLTAQQRDVR